MEGSSLFLRILDLNIFKINISVEVYIKILGWKNVSFYGSNMKIHMRINSRLFYVSSKMTLKKSLLDNSKCTYRQNLEFYIICSSRVIFYT